MISRELHQIMIDSLDGKEFQTKAFDEAFNDGFFQPDDKADMLDCCEVLSNANLPLPKHMLQQITEFNKNKENLSLNGKLLTVINAYQTLASVIQISMPGEKLIQELKIVASNYAANKAGVKLPAVGEDQVKLLKSNDIKEQQIRFRKIELFLFYNGIKKQLSPLNLRMAKAMVDSCVDKETRLLVSEKDIATLQKYLKEYY